MAGGFSLSVNISGLEGGTFGPEVQRIIDRAIPIFMNKLGEEMTAALAREMPFSRRAGRRPRPPKSKTGNAARSLRFVRRGMQVDIFAVDYLVTLQRAGWDMVTPAWMKTQPKLQGFFDEAIRKVQGR